MLVAAAIGIAAIDHGRDGEVQAVRNADADPGFTAIMSGVDGNGCLACSRWHQHRCDRDCGDDAAPGFPLVIDDLVLQAGILRLNAGNG